MLGTKGKEAYHCHIHHEINDWKMGAMRTVISHADLHRKMMGRPTQEGRAWAEAHHARPAYHGVDDMIED